MSFQNIQSFDALSIGRSPGFWPRLYNKAPTVNDINYVPGQFWIDTATNGVYFLENFTNSGGMPQANWVLIASSGFLQSISDTANTVALPSSAIATPPLNIQLTAGAGISVVTTQANPGIITITNTAMASLTLTGDSGGAASPSGANINTLSLVVANGAIPAAIQVVKTAGATLTWKQQVTTTNATADVTKAGVGSFNSAQFQVSGGNEGFISLKGSTTNAPILGLIPDITSGGGTNPVLANSSGNITITTSAIQNTGTFSTGLGTISNAINQLAIRSQFAGSNPAVFTANNFGLSQFDSNIFTVTGGYVTISGGSSGLVTKLLGDDGGANTVVPAAGGIITLIGVTVLNAVNAKPVFFKKNGTNTEELDVQVCTTSTSGAKSINNAGLASFDNTQFTVDSATGFVQAITSTNFPAENSVQNLGITYSAGTFTVCSANGTALSAGNPGFVTMQSSVNPGRVKTYTITANQTFTDSAGANSIAGNTFGVSCVAGRSWDQDMPFYLYAVSNSSAGSPETAISFMICRLSGGTFTQGAATIGKTGSSIASTQYSFFALSTPTVADYANSAALCIGAFRMQSTANIASWTVQTLTNGFSSTPNQTKTNADGIGQFHEGTKFWQPLGTMGNIAASIFGLANACTFTAGSLPVSYSLSSGGIVNIYATFSPNSGGSGSNQARYNLPFTPVGGAAGAGGVINNGVAAMTIDGQIAFSTFYNTSSAATLTNAAFTSGITHRFGSVYNARFI